MATCTLCTYVCTYIHITLCVHLLVALYYTYTTQTQCHLSFSSQLGNWLFGPIVLNTHNMPSWTKSTEHTTDYKNYKLI